MENFVVRRITSEGLESNTMLGEDYNILYRIDDVEEFESHCKVINLDRTLEKECYALIVYKDGSVTMPLYMKSEYYVMTTGGNTFANVSCRGLRKIPASPTN